MISTIKFKREKAGLTLVEVSQLLGKSYEWLRLVELGRTKIPAAIEAEVVRTIEDLAIFKGAASREGLKIFVDRKLPRRITKSARG